VSVPPTACGSSADSWCPPRENLLREFSGAAADDYIWHFVAVA